VSHVPRPPFLLSGAQTTSNYNPFAKHRTPERLQPCTVSLRRRLS
jgi:hypothetical protein